MIITYCLFNCYYLFIEMSRFSFIILKHLLQYVMYICNIEINTHAKNQTSYPRFDEVLC